VSLQSANSGSEARPGDGGSLWQDAKSALARLWQGVLDLVLILWVVRVPFGGVLLGFLIIAETPQADALFGEAPSQRRRRFRLYMRSHKSRFGKLLGTLGSVACLDSQHFLSWG
jgi:hypothetical protein